MRTLMLQGGRSVYGLLPDCGALLAATTILVILDGKLYPNVVR